MGRPRVMHTLILDLLRDQPLRFNEIKRQFEARYSRKIADNVLYENLENLLRAHLVERVLDDEGKVRYRVTGEYYKKEVVEKLKTFIAEAAENRNFEFEYQFRSHIAPLVSMMESSENPAQKLNWERMLKELEQHGVVTFNLFEPIRKFLEAEDRINETLFEFAHSPAEAFAYRMYDWLDNDSKIKVARFLAWAYWAGFQNHRARDNLEERMFRLKSTLEGQRILALRSKEAGEKALRILGYIKEAYSKQNLKELLEYLFSKKKEVEMLMHEILEKEGDTTSICNSDFFNRLFAFHNIILSGLCCAFPGEEWAGEEVLWLYSKVWSRFAMLVFRDTPDVLAEVSGDLDMAIRMVRENADALDILIELPKKCRCILVYLWGYDDILRLADKSVVLRIDEWINELKRGQLDHRINGGIECSKVEKICRSLIHGRPPPKEKIDSSEVWTAYDLYMHHPRGKDPNFWIQEILETIRKRISLGLPGPPEEQTSA